MAKLFDILETTVAIPNLTLAETQGDVTHNGAIDVQGNFNVEHNLTVKGTITADVVNIKTLVTENGSLASVGDWAYNTEEELQSKGFNWTWGGGSTRLSYRIGNKLWTNANIDLKSGSTYSIDGISVLSEESLGSTVINSNLRTVGTLEGLRVTGNANISDFAFFNDTFNRFGIGTEEPNYAISIIENNVELGIGSPATGLAVFGTHSNHDVGIITDNTPRITVKNNGEVQIGNEGNNTVLRVYGTLQVDNLISDTRIDRTSPLEFKANRETSIYGNGLLWTGEGVTRQFVMRAGPDRLYSSESIDIATDQSYYAGGLPVLTGNSLGASITKSSLTTLGLLQSLDVTGSTTLGANLDVKNGAVTTNSVVVSDSINNLTIDSKGIKTSNSITISTQTTEAFYADTNEIGIGDKNSSRRPVRVFGPMSVGVSNPDPDVDLTVKGNVSFANKKFVTGNNRPSDGQFNIGDICWNEMPLPNSYIGWVCIVAGAPGEWAPFGMIASQ